MNSDLYSVLLRQARRNEMITYGQIMTQFGFDQNQLHKELEAISRHEFEHKHPMLTVMAEYKGGGYGFEFFKLAEEFGHGIAEELKSNGFAKKMRVDVYEFWRMKSGADERSYYLLGSKYGEHANISMIEEMVENSVISVGFYEGSLDEYYLKSEAEIKQYLINEGEEPKSYNALKKFLQLRPGDVVAIKKSGSPRGIIANLTIDAYAIVVEKDEKVYSYDSVKLGHCINVEFLDTGLNKQFEKGGYNSTIAKISEIELISQLFNGTLPKDEQLMRRKIRKRRASEGKSTNSQKRSGSGPYVASSQHNDIQVLFAKHLIEKYGPENVKLEEDFVDIKVDLGNSIIFYEVKPYHLVEDCIIAALGQLLSYGFFSEDKRTKKLIVIGPSMPSQEEQEFINYLKMNSKFNFEYEGFEC